MPLQTGRDWDSPPAWLFLDSLTILFHLFCSPSRWHASKWNSSSFSTASFWPLLFPTYRRLQLPLYTRNRNMFCRPIEVQSLPSNLGTFWRHSANTWKEAKSGTRTSVLSFAVLKIRINDRKSKVGFLSAFTICGGIKEQRVDLNIFCAVSGRRSSFSPWRPQKTSLNYDWSAKNAWETTKHLETSNVNTAVTKPWSRQIWNLLHEKRSPCRAQTVMRTSIKYQKWATFLFR